MIANKWVLKTGDSYQIGDKELVKTDSIAIPPTDGDRTDIIGESGKYYYNMTKAEFMKRQSPEEYLEECLPGLDNKDKLEALKSISSTPRKIDDQISIIIEIRSGEINLKGK